jgi:hypothetical protein
MSPAVTAFDLESAQERLRKPLLTSPTSVSCRWASSGPRDQGRRVAPGKWSPDAEGYEVERIVATTADAEAAPEGDVHRGGAATSTCNWPSDELRSRPVPR